MASHEAEPRNRKFLFVLCSLVAVFTVTIILIARPTTGALAWALGAAFLAAAGSVGVSQGTAWIRGMINQRIDRRRAQQVSFYTSIGIATGSVVGVRPSLRERLPWSVSRRVEKLYDAGDLAGAADLYRQVLDARRRRLGPEHPDTLEAVNNLADTLYDAGDLAGATDLRQQADDASRQMAGVQATEADWSDLPPAGQRSNIGAPPPRERRSKRRKPGVRPQSPLGRLLQGKRNTQPPRGPRPPSGGQGGGNPTAPLTSGSPRGSGNPVVVTASARKEPAGRRIRPHLRRCSKRPPGRRLLSSF
jgi:hypothetical protein